MNKLIDTRINRPSWNNNKLSLSQLEEICTITLNNLGININKTSTNNLKLLIGLKGSGYSDDIIITMNEVPTVGCDVPLEAYFIGSSLASKTDLWVSYNKDEFISDLKDIINIVKSKGTIKEGNVVNELTEAFGIKKRPKNETYFDLGVFKHNILKALELGEFDQYKYESLGDIWRAIISYPGIDTLELNNKDIEDMCYHINNELHKNLGENKMKESSVSLTTIYESILKENQNIYKSKKSIDKEFETKITYNGEDYFVGGWFTVYGYDFYEEGVIYEDDIDIDYAYHDDETLDIEEFKLDPKDLGQDFIDFAKKAVKKDIENSGDYYFSMDDFFDFPDI